MSLKAFHIFFIACSALLAFGLGGAELAAWSRTGSAVTGLLGVAGILAGLGLIVYGVLFLRKLRHVGFL